jgi:hypothetical protein
MAKAPDRVAKHHTHIAAKKGAVHRTLPKKATTMQTDLNTSAGHAREMTVEQLLCLGNDKVVYLKSTVFGGGLAFMIYSADGIPLEVVDGLETAVARAEDSGFSFVRVH